MYSICVCMYSVCVCVCVCARVCVCVYVCAFCAVISDVHTFVWLPYLCRPQWCPVLYLIAVHHVHSFVFSQNNEVSSLFAVTVRHSLNCLHEARKLTDMWGDGTFDCHERHPSTHLSHIHTHTYTCYALDMYTLACSLLSKYTSTFAHIEMK